MDLEKIRNEIDAIDNQITELLTKRLDLSIEVAAYKKANNLSIYHPEREKIVIERVTAQSREEYSGAITQIYKCLMDEGKKIQESKM